MSSTNVQAREVLKKYVRVLFRHFPRIRICSTSLSVSPAPQLPTSPPSIALYLFLPKLLPPSLRTSSNSPFPHSPLLLPFLLRHLPSRAFQLFPPTHPLRLRYAACNSVRYPYVRLSQPNNITPEKARGANAALQPLLQAPVSPSLC